MSPPPPAWATERGGGAGPWKGLPTGLPGWAGSFGQVQAKVRAGATVEQILPEVERALMHSVLRLPQNTFCHSDFYHFHEIGVPKFR